MTKRGEIDPILAAALKKLRRMSGKVAKEVAPQLGVTQQGLSRWENAQTSMPADKIDAYLRAIGATRDDLDHMVGVSERGQDYLLAPPVPALEGLEMFEVKDESMSPWCEPGENVLFQRGKHPKRMEGCLVEFRDGRRMVRLFGRERDGHIFLHRINPESTEQYLHSDIVGLHRVAFRGG